MSINGFVILMSFLTAAGPSAEKPADPKGPVPQMFVTSARCIACHNNLTAPTGRDVSIGADWQSTMMAHASKDPYWQAAVRRETIDHASSSAAIQNECSACHMPMDRYQANAEGRMGEVFARLPFAPAPAPGSVLAADGVSCNICHQISPEGLGTRESFTAGFHVDTETPAGERHVFGPFDVDEGRRRVMRTSSGFDQQKSDHIHGSELCASCHTLITHTLAPDGKVIGELPEQVPYLEWKHSAFSGKRHCQSCHMPVMKDEMPISSVLPRQREGFSRHAFRGGNFLMPAIFNRFGDELGVTAPARYLDITARQTMDNLETAAARLQITRAEISGDTLLADVKVINMTGHKLPTAYPSRRVWIHFTVRSEGTTLFDSGSLNADGSIAGNDNDMQPGRFEPHYEVINTADEVQIYEPVMVGPDDRVTTGLLTAIRYVKDNRLLPAGFDKNTADKDVEVHGAAMSDDDFIGAGDVVRYILPVPADRGPLVIEAELWYQPIGFRWARNLGEYDTAESARFTGYFDTLSKGSGAIIAGDRRMVE
jgi:hypothetical protein